MGRDLLLFAALERIDQLGLVPGDVLADKDQHGRLLRKGFEIPAPGDVIEQIGPLCKTRKAFGPNDRRAQTLNERVKTLPFQSRRGDIAERFYAKLVTMPRRA